MLARGAICRLAADIPKTSTQQLVRVLQRNILRRNALHVPAMRALLRAYATFGGSRRSYATTAKATKPTATVKRAVKKTAAKKPAATKKAVAKKTATKKKAKAKPKSKPKKKVAAKPKKTPKVLTPEEKERKVIRELRDVALREPVTRGSVSAWMVFTTEALFSKPRSAANLGSIKDKYNNLTPAEKEHYNHVANEKTAAKLAEYRAWVHSYTPQQIRTANNARALLRKKLATALKKPPRHTVPIQDDRWTVKRPPNAYAYFFTERQASGDLKGIPIGEGGKLIGNEWNALSTTEKKKYEDQYAADRAEYVKEYEKVFGIKPGARARKDASKKA